MLFGLVAELGHRLRRVPPRAAGLPPRRGEQRADREPECVRARLPPRGRRCLSGAAGGGAAGRIASGSCRLGRGWLLAAAWSVRWVMGSLA